MYRTIFYYILLSFLTTKVQSDYWTERNDFIFEEQSLAIGNKIILNEKEQQANQILMNAKKNELQKGFLHPELFPPAQHFFNAKKNIEDSKVFKIIRRMPKGGALHLHDTAIVSTDYILYNITYRDNLFLCKEDETQDDIKLTFAFPSPEDPCWQSVKSLREESRFVEDFDLWLRGKLTMVVDDPEELYPDLNTAWKKFEGIFKTVTPMLTYRPVWKDYFYKGLEELLEDNVNYVEIRGTLPVIYDLSGWPLNPIQNLGLLQEVAERFKKDHPDFIGIKYIYAPSRHVEESIVNEYLQIYQMMKELYPDFLIGFDLVSQEDLGDPLTNFIPVLLKASDEVKFFFHAGETNWNGMPSDLNLVDAVLLNTTRIGHGYALTKHPKVLKEIKNRKIGIELNPISNQVLMLVKDLRNHPASSLFAEDYPVVVSSDGPSLWGAKGLSYDFYEAFMGIAGASCDLRMLKQLCVNSFLYSGMTKKEQDDAMLKWQHKWDEFIEEIVYSKNSEMYFM